MPLESTREKQQRRSRRRRPDPVKQMATRLVLYCRPNSTCVISVPYSFCCDSRRPPMELMSLMPSWSRW